MVHSNMDRTKVATAVLSRKRKIKPQPTSSELKNIKPQENQATGTVMSPTIEVKPKKRSKKKKLVASEVTQDELSDRFPILKDSDLVNKFMRVPISNNQKGRIRQLMKDSLRGTSDVIMPEVIHTKILNILKSSNNLTDTDLRRIRILYNMLKTATVEREVVAKRDSMSPDTKDPDSPPHIRQAVKSEIGDEEKKSQAKAKKARRHVVFVGNLPSDVTKEKLKDHFAEIVQDIVDIRIPKPEDEKKSAIAYIEIKDDHNYEYALSKHHTMLGNRRINVLYTTQPNSKVTKAEAKSKSAKMIALQKQGKLVGSVPLIKKRSQRRKKMKMAQAKEAAEEEAKHRGPQSFAFT